MMSLKTLPVKFNAFLGLTLICVSSFALSTAHAANDKNKANDENIEVTQQHVTQEELAAIYVLSEICPKLIDKNQNFNPGYSNLLQDYMPGVQNPTDTLKRLSKEKAFQPILKEARADAKKAGDKANLGVCQDVVNYQPYK